MKEQLSTDILILGAGIGGYESFRTLSKQLKRKGVKKKITIIDRNNYFTFVPMLHEVATGSIEPTHAAILLRLLVAGTPHAVLQATVEHVDPEKKLVTTDAGTIEFTDACVIALGSGTNYFDTPGADTHTYNVRTLDAAMQLKYDFLEALDTCTAETLYITIVGGGYTGVEVAGQYADLAEKDLKKLYPEKTIHIRVIQSRPTVLPYKPEKVQHRVCKRLASQGVEILTDERVIEVKKDAVVLKSGTTLESNITIWTAGFSNLGPSFLDKGYNEKGRIEVTGGLTMHDYPHMYAVGDIANITDDKTNIAYPQLAEAAHHEGKYAAHHIVRTQEGKKTKRFVFRSKGQLMPVGDWWGVAEIGPFVLYGKLAWWIRRTVYILFMPGILRKLRIVFDWTVHSFGYRDFINVNPKDKT